MCAFVRICKHEHQHKMRCVRACVSVCVSVCVCVSHAQPTESLVGSELGKKQWSMKLTRVPPWSNVTIMIVLLGTELPPGSLPIHSILLSPNATSSFHLLVYYPFSLTCNPYTLYLSNFCFYPGHSKLIFQYLLLPPLLIHAQTFPDQHLYSAKSETFLPLKGQFVASKYF